MDGLLGVLSMPARKDEAWYRREIIYWASYTDELTVLLGFMTLSPPSLQTFFLDTVDSLSAESPTLFHSAQRRQTQPHTP